MNYKCLLILLVMMTQSTFAADDVVNTQTKNTITQNTAVNTKPVGTAKDWELNNTDWDQYLNLMHGPSGHYYASLSPPEVLGIQAETNEDLRHYAEIAAKLEHDKLERELRFNAAFHEAAAKLYSTEPIIKPFDFTPFTPIPKN
jgi:integrating conjugative element protein (TIGR03759 family)